MADKEERIRPVEGIGTLRVAAIRPFGYEQGPQERKKEGKKRDKQSNKPTYGGIISAEKVDFKI